MGARLMYAKVVDRQRFMIRGGKIHPGLDNEVLINEEPGRVAAFLVLRAWSEERGTFTEQWRLESPGGSKLYTSTPRELHLATESHVERLEDEIADLEIEYAAEDYCVVFQLDDREVARVDFPIRVVETDPQDTTA
ncbi:MAG: hypothetical protein M3214_12960 [Actinomycetota bacterium]|nr:hypothetical protein [Actinomycetota bacterium]